MECLKVLFPLSSICIKHNYSGFIYILFFQNHDMRNLTKKKYIFE